MDPVAPNGPRAAAGALEPGPVLVSVAALGVVAAQLALRSADDSRLASWSWGFAGIDPVRLFALVAAAIAAAHLAVRAPVPARARGPLLVLLAFAAGACTWPAPEAIVDASRYFAQAKHLELHGLGGFLAAWGRELPAWTDLPLVPALYGLVFRALGEARIGIQLLGTLLFAGAVLLTWRTGAALFDEGVGLAAGALLLAVPYLLTQVPAMLVDVPTMFFLALATWAVVLAVRRGGAGRLALAAAAVFLAAASKYSAWLLLTGLPALALAERGRSPGALRRAAAIGLGAGLLAGAALLAGRDVASAQLALLRSYQAPGLRRWGESFVSTFLFQAHPLLAAGALLSAGLAARRRDARWIAVAWPVLLLLVLDVRRVRYWVPAFPALALLAALGLQAIRDARLRALAVGCAVTTSLVVALYGQLPFLARTSAANLRSAGAYLDGLPDGAVEVLTPRRPGAAVNPAVSVPILDLFTARRLVYRYEAPPADAVLAARRSPLRFTWEYRNPPYYEDGGAGPPAAVVLVTDDLDAPLPPELARRLEGLRLAAAFARDEGVFEHRTLVRVYRRDAHGAARAP
ncbi:MAG TPA: glycosyltransferase family 39 protein [Anaeromyxobacter sp.]|nr:glycosyltransferase family 39 protein [Anaeromyxobacter sp.]